MADQQPTVVGKGDDPLMASHPPPPSTDGALQLEETDPFDSAAVMNGERIIINLW